MSSTNDFSFSKLTRSNSYPKLKAKEYNNDRALEISPPLKEVDYSDWIFDCVLNDYRTKQIPGEIFLSFLPEGMVIQHFNVEEPVFVCGERIFIFSRGLYGLLTINEVGVIVVRGQQIICKDEGHLNYILSLCSNYVPEAHVCGFDESYVNNCLRDVENNFCDADVTIESTKEFCKEHVEKIETKKRTFYDLLNEVRESAIVALKELVDFESKAFINIKKKWDTLK